MRVSENVPYKFCFVRNLSDCLWQRRFPDSPDRSSFFPIVRKRGWTFPGFLPGILAKAMPVSAQCLTFLSFSSEP
ncbi:hypothetical protein ABH19_03430 [Leptospirillum sp. Group II 'CF-1']|uniref:hypothetical protein n=1 Tax=Leptospirillum sp. Group II 'CF-1' TaxID=1660083 RepID=UPI0002F8225E|nr:hypothetical protein [Leptospirillum sp. Group II 'CF-1']AKS23006.1 hypothetical protein ABH19_03430 [Leptospirillum sp. Group II 'CF-1']